MRYLKQYPLSLAVICLILYLSLFRPPQLDANIPLFEGFDKLVHMAMYGLISTTLWVEFLHNHRHHTPVPYYRAWIGACLAPILFGGLMELAQAYLTNYRSGDWLDFLANSVGALSASLTCRYLLKSWFIPPARKP